MKRNLGNIDRAIRLALSLLLIYVGLVDTDILGDDLVNLGLAAFGIFNLIVITAGICPVYSLAGITTHRATSNKDRSE